MTTRTDTTASDTATVAATAADTADTPTTPPLDIRGDHIPFARLVDVELRKMVDTRAGLWMLVVMAAISVLVSAVLVIWGTPADQTFATYLGMIFIPLTVLLPVLGIMSATQEWSHRTWLATFTLVPRRGRVLTAKAVAALALTLGLLVVAAIAAAVATAISGGTFSLTGLSLVGVVITALLLTLQGVAFGAALLNTPLAIVGILVLPTVWMVLTSSISWMSDAARWLDLTVVTLPLTEGTMTAEAWGQLATSSAAWVLLPLAIGTRRVLTREIS